MVASAVYNVGFVGFNAQMLLHRRGFFFFFCLLWGVIGTGRSPHSFPFAMHYTCVQVRQMRGRWWEKGMRVWEEKKRGRKGVGNRKAAECWMWYRLVRREKGEGVKDHKMPGKKRICNVQEMEKEKWRSRRRRVWLASVQRHLRVLNLFTVITGSTGAHCLFVDDLAAYW